MSTTNQTITELTVIDILEIHPPAPELQTPAPPRKPYLCRHIFVDGHQCGSRALRGQDFCYYHYAHRTPVLANQRRRQPASGFDLTLLDGLDNHSAIQLSISEVLGRIASNSIDPKRAWLLLYGLQIAGNNLRRARPNPEAAVPETIVEDAAHGQLAELEPGRPAPPSLTERMCALLEADPTADPLQLIHPSSNADFPIPQVQTQPLQIETLGPKDRGVPQACRKCNHPRMRKLPMTDSAPKSATTRTTGLSPKEQKLQAMLAKAAHKTSGAKPAPGASAQSFSAKTSFAGKKTSFQRKAV